MKWWGIHHAAMEERKLLEYAALAESASSHPISKSLQKAYGKELDRSRVTEVQEISGHGVWPRWTESRWPRATTSSWRAWELRLCPAIRWGR